MNSSHPLESSRRTIITLGLLLIPLIGSGAPSLDISTDHENALYKVSDTVTFTIQAKDGDEDLNHGEISWTLSMDGFGKRGEGKQSIEGGKAVEATGSLDRPGFLLLTAVFTGADGKKITAYGGAGISPLEIPPSMPVPDDFDQFWASQKENLTKVPMEFSIGMPVPLTPTGVQSGGETQPMFTWSGSSKNEWYQIYLQRNGAKVADPWLPTNQVVNESWDISVANPNSSPANLILELSSGDYQWWIKGYSAADGSGPWIEGPDFTIEED